MPSKNPKRKTKRLVIDTSVAKAAGESEHPVSKYCRDFLKGVLEICHSLVMTQRISDEWKKHRSLFTAKWQRVMVAKKKVDSINITQREDLQKEIISKAASKRDREEMKKDLSLIEAALATDRIVVSLDEEAKKLFTEAARHVVRLKQIAWINPHQDNDAIECLNKPHLVKKHFLGLQKSS